MQLAFDDGIEEFRAAFAVVTVAGCILHTSATLRMRSSGLERR